MYGFLDSSLLYNFYTKVPKNTGRYITYLL